MLSSNHRSRYQIIDHVIKSLVRKTARVITRPQSRPLARCWRVVLHAPRARRCACVPSMKKGIECAYWCLSSYAHNCPCAHVRMADGRTVVLCSNRRTVVLCSNGRTIGAPATQQATQAKCAVASLRHQLLKPSVQACATSSAGKNCMCATPPAPTPAVSPSRREIGAEAFQTRLVKHTASMHLLPSIQEHTCAHLLRTPCEHDYTPVTSVHLYPPVLKCASLRTCCHLYPAPAPFSRASTL